ncbi:MAG: MATE family efflux transporter [Erysipelotrichaceae bacterium]|uniref:MATE family efflux transporter n=1 Tax=Floccifex sp. TaxID=2815810 RepID=UPI0029FF03A3|nr:MATE family efflux transporter [Floccifex sp.]MDD7282245.1 MATE family efflux transporter [Erysipelotrichaceae bacterium]MDY2958814.1 MATE family efflux transporter [Floccifex sp.]
MKDNSRQDLFESTPIPKAVMNLAIPTMLSSLVMVIYNLSDTYFVGMLNNPIQNAAVTLAAPLLLAFNAINNLFGVGSSSMMSRALGRKDEDTVSRSSAFGFYCALSCGLLFSIIYLSFQPFFLNLLGCDVSTVDATRNYLKWTVGCGAIPAILNVVMAYLVRAEGATLHASIGTMSGCLLNIILDPLLILPQTLNMGAAGAGLATFISNCVACIYFFVLLYIKRKTTYVCIQPKMFCIRKDIVLGVFGVGVPASIQNLLNVTGMTILNNFTSGYGSQAVAAMGIAQKINMVPMYIAQGFSQGIMPLVSYNYASKNHKRMKEAIYFSVKVSMSFMVTMVVIYQFASPTLMTLFMENVQIVQYGTKFLKAMSLALPFLALDFLCVGIFQACGKGTITLVFAILRKVVLEIPALFILDHFYPLYGLAYAQFCAEFILSLIAITILIHFLKQDLEQ